MSRFRNPLTGAVVSVDDSKDHRFSAWERVGKPAPKPRSRRTKKSAEK